MILKSHMIYFSPQKNRLFMVTRRGLNSYVFEVVIIMCGLNRFPSRDEMKSFFGIKSFFPKIIINPKCACAVLQILSSAVMMLQNEKKIRYIDISGFPLERTSKEDIKIQ